MPSIDFDPHLCQSCGTVDCLMRCQYMDFDLESAMQERDALLNQTDSRVLEDCLTCYACEEYCPAGNHPFYRIVELQEKKGIHPAPIPLARQQMVMMQPRGTITASRVSKPVIHMCYFPMLTHCIRGPLYEGSSMIVGSDIFCNIMWLHFAANRVIRERLPKVIDNIWTCYLRDSGVDELVCFHDECHGTFTHLAPAFGIDVPFRSIHLFEYLSGRLDALTGSIRPLGARIAYQRPCSNRLVPETDRFADEIFEKIGVTRVDRTYDRENALCCGGVPRIHQRDDLADDIQDRNIEDMVAAKAEYCVFNCPACLMSLGEAVAARGIMPILMSDLCQAALAPTSDGKEVV